MGRFKDIDVQLQEDILANACSMFATMDRMATSVGELTIKRIYGDVNPPQVLIDRMIYKAKIGLIRALNDLADESERIDKLGEYTYTKHEMNNEVNR